MSFEFLTLDRSEGVATITLNRPDAFNALSLGLGRELFHAALDVDEDPAVRWVVVPLPAAARRAPPRDGALLHEPRPHGAGSARVGAGDARGAGRRARDRGQDAGPGARAGTVEGLRWRQAAVPSIDVGEPRDPDGARGAGDRRQRPHRGFQERGDRVRPQAGADVPREVTRGRSQPESGRRSAGSWGAAFAWAWLYNRLAALGVD